MKIPVNVPFLWKMILTAQSPEQSFVKSGNNLLNDLFHDVSNFYLDIDPTTANMWRSHFFRVVEFPYYDGYSDLVKSRQDFLYDNGYLVPSDSTLGTYKVFSDVKSVASFVDTPYKPSFTLEEGSNFEIQDGVIFFNENLFEDVQYIEEQRHLPWGKTITVKIIRLIATDITLNESPIFDNFGGLVYDREITDAETEIEYRSKILGLLYLCYSGPTEMAMNTALNVALGYPVMLHHNETVEDISVSGAEVTVTTDKEEYSFSSSSGLLNEDLFVGGVFDKFTPITTTISVSDHITDPTWIDGETLPSQFFYAPTEYQTVDFSKEEEVRVRPQADIDPSSGIYGVRADTPMSETYLKNSTPKTYISNITNFFWSSYFRNALCKINVTLTPEGATTLEDLNILNEVLPIHAAYLLSATIMPTDSDIIPLTGSYGGEYAFLTDYVSIIDTDVRLLDLDSFSSPVTKGEDATITWSQEYISEVTIDYSGDGSSWTIIDTDVTASDESYTWTVPGSLTDDEVYIRIIQEDHGSPLTDQETLTLSEPTPEEPTYLFLGAFYPVSPIEPALQSNELDTSGTAPTIESSQGFGVAIRGPQYPHKMAVPGYFSEAIDSDADDKYVYVLSDAAIHKFESGTMKWVRTSSYHLSGAMSLTVSEDYVFILREYSRGGLLVLDKNDFSFVSEDPSVYIGAYSYGKMEYYNGYVYVSDPTEHHVMRYPVSGYSFGAVQTEYIDSGFNPALNFAVVGGRTYLSDSSGEEAVAANISTSFHQKDVYFSEWVGTDVASSITSDGSRIYIRDEEDILVSNTGFSADLSMLEFNDTLPHTFPLGLSDIDIHNPDSNSISALEDTNEELASIMLPLDTYIDPSVSPSLTIRWVSSNIENVNLYYSYQGGSDGWQSIDTVDGAVGEYTWSIPFSNPTEPLFLWIKVENASDSTQYKVDSVVLYDVTIGLKMTISTREHPSVHNDVHSQIKFLHLDNIDNSNSDGGTLYINKDNNRVDFYSDSARMSLVATSDGIGAYASPSPSAETVGIDEENSSGLTGQMTILNYEGQDYDQSDNVHTSQVNKGFLPVRQYSPNDVIDCTVNWGDGSSSTVTAKDDPNREHTYSSAGSYQLTIEGGYSTAFSSTSYPVFSDLIQSFDEIGGAVDLMQAGGGYTPSFGGCHSVTHIPHFPIPYDHISSAFFGLSSLETIGGLIVRNSSHNANCSDAFTGCSSLEEAPIRIDTYAGHENPENVSFSDTAINDPWQRNIIYHGLRELLDPRHEDYGSFSIQMPSEEVTGEDRTIATEKGWYFIGGEWEHIRGRESSNCYFRDLSMSKDGGIIVIPYHRLDLNDRLRTDYYSGGWSTSDFVSSGNVGLWSVSSHVSSTSDPVVAYSDNPDSSSGKITVKSLDVSSGTWSVVGTPEFSNNKVQATAITSYSNGDYIVAFFDDYDHFCVSRFDGGSWVSLGTELSPLTSWETNPTVEISVDNDDNVYVLCGLPNVYEGAFLMKHDGSSWSQVGGEIGSNFTYGKLAVSPSGTPYVVTFKSEGTDRYDFHVFNGSSWVTEEDFTGGDISCDMPGLAVHPVTGDPYVAYAPLYSSGSVFRHNGTTFETAGTPTYPNSGNRHCLFFDDTGTMYVSVVDPQYYPPPPSSIDMYKLV